MILIVNGRAIHHDLECYDAPDEFRPERYKSNEFGYKVGYKAPDGIRKTYGFGAGRRICPGQHLAENSLVRYHMLDTESFNGKLTLFPDCRYQQACLGV